MNHRRWLMFAIPLVGTFAAGILGYTILKSSTDSNAPLVKGKNGDMLPIRQVVLFNSGVGYFQREGEVEGNARIQLHFPTSDINDLLKSLVLRDAKGQIGTVNYDSSDPIDKILRSFALDLTNNPTFGQILNQARGEKIEINRIDKSGPVVKVNGTIIGMEMQKRSVGKDQVIDVEILNLNTSTGLQAIPMEQVVTVRFLNPMLESEFQRALGVLATSHDTQKKTVSVGFNGEGKRMVQVGYVVERPIWKTTYRLRLDPNGKVFLQGWALVENTSDDDWTDVRMVLVSGKPISFKMNLYDPIYIPRPFVEPETFASLRPPVYSGALGEADMKKFADAGIPMPPIPMPSLPTIPPGFGQNGIMPQMDKAAQNLNKFQQQPMNMQQLAQNLPQEKGQNKLTYDELQRRRQEQVAKLDQAKKIGGALTGFNFKEGIQSVATADEIGDYYQYAIDQKVTLPRQKSAMLPILDQHIEGQKFSIYNESIHAKYPLLGLKLKNTSGQPLTQGPITVYDGGVFAGDTRILDLQPNEDRLLSYALDQSTEIKTTTKQAPSPELHFRIGGDQLTAKYDMRQTKTYTIKNRSTHDREVILEHPLRPEWKLADPKKPLEKTRDLYRFQVSVPAGKTVSYDVVEDLPRLDPFALHGGQPSYAVANGINVKVATSVDQHQLIALRIVKGFVQPTYKVRETKAYFVQNLSDLDRTFIFDHVVRPGWTRLDDKNEPQNGPEVFRFKLSIDKGKTGQQAIREERTTTENGTLLKTLSETAIRQYLANPVPSADVKTAMTKALGMQAKIVETQKQLMDQTQQLKVLSEDQARVRENLKIIPQTSDHYKKFLEKFVGQETQIETFQAAIRQINTTLQNQQREVDLFIAKLDAN